MTLHRPFERETCLDTRIFVDLRSQATLGLRLGSRSVEGFTLLSIGEILNLADLKLSILFNE